MSGATGTEAERGQDPGGARGILAGRYAGALYDLAEERSALDPTIAEMAQLARAIDQSEPLRRLLGSPLVRADAASAALTGMLDGFGCSPLLRDFVGVVASNRRLASLRAIAAAFAQLVASRRGIVTAAVATAHPLTDLQRNQLRARLAESGYSDVRLDERLDPSLIGGMTLRVGARLYDASIKSRLQRLAYRMKGAA